MSEKTKIDIKEVLELHKMHLDGTEGGKKANLQGANLQYADLQGANLQHANFQHANLQYANLQGANLHGADLQGANLQYANLQYADLQGADFQHANLQYANLQGANLQGADLDFSVLYFSCSSLSPKTDERQRIQLAFHLLSWIANADNATEFEKGLYEHAKDYANKFHRKAVERLP